MLVSGMQIVDGMQLVVDLQMMLLKISEVVVVGKMTEIKRHVLQTIYVIGLQMIKIKILGVGVK